MIPEWVWIIIVGVILIGLVKALWGARNQGFLSAEDHTKLCGKMREEMCIDIDKVAASLGKTINEQYQNFQFLLNAKFESLDDKIENKILRELRDLSNGNGRMKSKPHKKRIT